MVTTHMRCAALAGAMDGKQQLAGLCTQVQSQAKIIQELQQYPPCATEHYLSQALQRGALAMQTDPLLQESSGLGQSGLPRMGLMCALTKQRICAVTARHDCMQHLAGPDSRPLAVPGSHLVVQDTLHLAVLDILHLVVRDTHHLAGRGIHLAGPDTLPRPAVLGSHHPAGLDSQSSGSGSGRGSLHPAALGIHHLGDVQRSSDKRQHENEKHVPQVQQGSTGAAPMQRSGCQRLHTAHVQGHHSLLLL